MKNLFIIWAFTVIALIGAAVIVTSNAPAPKAEKETAKRYERVAVRPQLPNIVKGRKGVGASVTIVDGNVRSSVVVR